MSKSEDESAKGLGVFDNGVGKRIAEPFFSVDNCGEALKVVKDVVQELKANIPFFITNGGSPVRFLHVSEALCAITGRSESEIFEGVFSRSESGRDSEGWIEFVDGVRDGQEINTLIVSGSKQLRLNAIPIQNTIGRLVLYLGMMTIFDSSKYQVSGDSDLDQLAANIEQAMEWRPSLSRAQRRKLERIPFPEAFVISDPWRPDNPLVWCSPKFYRLTGYQAGEILGRNCRFLQGNDTDQEEIDKLREGIKAVKSITACFQNQRKDGSLFWNHISVYPVLDKDSIHCLFFSAMQYDASWLMELAIKSEGAELQADDGGLACLSRIDEVQVEVNALVRDIILGQAELDGNGDHNTWRLGNGVEVQPSDWEDQVKVSVIIGQACQAAQEDFEATAVAARLACSVWE